VPQHSRGVLEDTDVRRHTRALILYQRTVVLVELSRKDAGLDCEACETPIAFFCCESMVGVVVHVQCRIIRVGQYEHELCARIPVLWWLIVSKALFEIEGNILGVLIARREEKHPPRTSAALKDGTGRPFGQLSPICDIPSVPRFCQRFILWTLGHVFFNHGLMIVGQWQRIFGRRISIVVHAVVLFGCYDGDWIIVIVERLLLVVIRIDQHVASNLCKWKTGGISNKRGRVRVVG